jgi:thiol-disulfide isomerase/thioredoxin
MVLLWLALALADTPTDVTASEAAGRIQARRNVRLVHVWATWCGPCVREFDDLTALTRQLGPRGLQVIGLSVDASAGPPKAFLEDRRTGWTQLRVTDGRGLPDALASVGGSFRGVIPYNLLLDADGAVLASWTGAASADAVKRRVEPHLSGSGWTGPSAAQLEAMTQGMLAVDLAGREGDAVFIDNWRAGTVPLRTEVIGGLHDLRIEGEAGTVRLDQFLIEFVDGVAEVDVAALTGGGPTDGGGSP